MTFASIDAEDPYQQLLVHNPPPPPAPYDHKNMVFVNKNDLESILVKGAASQAAAAAAAAAQAQKVKKSYYHNDYYVSQFRLRTTLVS